MHGKTGLDENQPKTIDADTLQPINIVIITCPKLVQKRLSPIIQSLLKPLSLGYIGNFQIINDDDQNLFKEFSHINYLPELWKTHISKGWLHFYENLVLMNSCQFKSKKSYLGIDQLSIFPQRALSEVEHSIIYRHLKACSIASKQNGMTLILEDDALSLNQLKLVSTIRSLQMLGNSTYFIDLCDSYIPINITTSKNVEILGQNFKQTRKAKTRTLMAYGISQKLAKKIYSSSKYYSLPADMHMQIILEDINVEGLSISESPFSHASKNGIYLSSTELDIKEV